MKFLSLSAFMRNKEDQNFEISWLNEGVWLEGDGAHIYIEFVMSLDSTSKEISSMRIFIDRLINTVRNVSKDLLDEDYMRSHVDDYQLVDFVNRIIEVGGNRASIPKAEIELRKIERWKCTEIFLKFETPLKPKENYCISLYFWYPNMVKGTGWPIKDNWHCEISFYSYPAHVELPINDIMPVKYAEIWVCLPSKKVIRSESPIPAMKRMNEDESLATMWKTTNLSRSKTEHFFISYGYAGVPSWLVWVSLLLGLIGFIITILTFLYK